MANDEVKEEEATTEVKTDEIISGTDVALQESADIAPPPELPPPGSPNRIDVNIDQATATALKVQEFEKLIAEAEFAVYDLKKQKAAYIYDTNIQSLIKQAQQQKAKPQQ